MKRIVCCFGALVLGVIVAHLNWRECGSPVTTKEARALKGGACGSTYVAGLVYCNGGVVACSTGQLACSTQSFVSLIASGSGTQTAQGGKLNSCIVCSATTCGTAATITSTQNASCE